MSYGKMRSRILFCKKFTDKDADGFAREAEAPVAEVRAYREDRHGTESWRNRAAFTTAATLFRFRNVPGLRITADLCVVCDGEEFDIFSVEDVRGRGMYTEILCERVKPNG